MQKMFPSVIFLMKTLLMVLFIKSTVHVYWDGCVIPVGGIVSGVFVGSSKDGELTKFFS